MAPPPPPPPPLCFPFSRSSKSSRGSRSTGGDEKPSRTRSQSHSARSSLQRTHTGSSSSTLTSRTEKLTFESDSISWDNVPADEGTKSPKGSAGSRTPEALSPTISRTSSQKVPSRPGSGRGRASFLRSISFSGRNSSQATLVGSALDRKVVDQAIPSAPRVDTGERLIELRKLMEKEKIDYYIVPTADAHGSEYIAGADRRREWITGFTGSAGTALVSKNNAYLFTDSRYYIQAARELDDNWILQKIGWQGTKDWDDWVISRASGTKIGVDSRLISYTKATKLNTALAPRASSLVFPWQNLIDLIWKTRPARPKNTIFLHPLDFAGQDAQSKLRELRAWIRENTPRTGRFTTEPPPPQQRPVATLVSDLACIAWLLNLRGSDIPFNPVFHAHLFVTLDRAILFIDSEKVTPDVRSYLSKLGISTQEYSDIWPFLRGRDWGEGKVLIPPSAPYTVPRSLTSLRYTITPSFVDDRKAIKNDVELAGLERAYLRDGAAMVRWLAWLDEKVAHGYEINEYEAQYQLNEFRRKLEHYVGLAYENIAAAGPNAALPHYQPPRHDSRVIDRKTPFLIDSGGQYLDGTCDTTRTVHFGRPTEPQAEAFTRVLQGHIGIDSAIFPEGTSGAKLDVLARRALWKDGLNYLHGTGHGFGSFLNVHEGPQGFSSDVPLEPGHVITNEPGFYLDGEWGVRIESALIVRRVKTKGSYQGDIWLGFQRLTQVPIQIKMVKASMLSKEERAWVRDHNNACRRALEPILENDKRALRWLRKECQPGFRSEATVSGVSVDWD